MEFRIISIPPFRAAASEISHDFDFSENTVLGKFCAYFSAITPAPRDAFMPRDFLYFDAAQKGLRWMWALSEGMDDGGFAHLDFDGGMYVTYTYPDGDQAENERLYQAAVKFIEESPLLALDCRENHYPMGHIITPRALVERQGTAQMEAFVPVKLKDK